jgi:hydrogenase maturation protease
MTNPEKILVYGYGNPGRQDDGLGAAFIKLMEDFLKSYPMPGLSLDCNYQLNIEDASLISGYDAVIFVDASQEEIENYVITEVKPSKSRIEFSMHAVSVGFVLDLCIKMFGRAPRVFLLHIRGYEWNFNEELTLDAQQNLNLAFNFVSSQLPHLNAFDETIQKQEFNK